MWFGSRFSCVIFLSGYKHLNRSKRVFFFGHTTNKKFQKPKRWSINNPWENKSERERAIHEAKRKKNICSWINPIQPVIVHHVPVQLYKCVWVRIVRWNWMKRREGRKNGRIEERRKEKGWHRAKKNHIQNKNRTNERLARSCFCLNKTRTCNAIQIL